MDVQTSDGFRNALAMDKDFPTRLFRRMFRVRSGIGEYVVFHCDNNRVENSIMIRELLLRMLLHRVTIMLFYFNRSASIKDR